MPIRNTDYILRMIEQLGQMLSRLIGQLQAGDPGQLRQADDQLLEVGDRSGLDLRLADHLDRESLEMMYAPGGELDAGRCALLAELLYLRALVAAGDGEGELARRRLGKAQQLFIRLPADVPSEIELPAAEGRLRDVAELLASNALS